MFILSFNQKKISECDECCSFCASFFYFHFIFMLFTYTHTRQISDFYVFWNIIFCMLCMSYLVKKWSQDIFDRKDIQTKFSCLFSKMHYAFGLSYTTVWFMNNLVHKWYDDWKMGNRLRFRVLSVLSHGPTGRQFGILFSILPTWDNNKPRQYLERLSTLFKWAPYLSVSPSLSYLHGWTNVKQRNWTCVGSA